MFVVGPVRRFGSRSEPRNLGSRSVHAAALGLVLAVNAGATDIPYDYVVKFTPENAILGYFSSTKKPVVTVKSGAVVRLEVGGGARWGAGNPNAWLKENNIPTTIEACPALQETIKVLAETTNRLPPPEPPPGAPPPAAGAPAARGGGHMLIGPVYVEDAEPGDSLEVRILDVTPRIPYGTVGANPGSGALPDLVPRPFTKVVLLDLKRNAGIYDDNVEVPLGPFNGVIWPRARPTPRGRTAARARRGRSVAISTARNSSRVRRSTCRCFRRARCSTPATATPRRATAKSP